MHRSRIHAFTVFLLVAVLPSSCRSAVNEGIFVNGTKHTLKILAVFGFLDMSHFYAFQPLLEELARRGHDLTVLSHFPRSEKAKTQEALPTYKDISLLDPKVRLFVDIFDLHLIDHEFFSPVSHIFRLNYVGGISCRVSLKNSAVERLLQSDKKFDLIILEYFNTDCFLGFVHRFKVPHITVSSHLIMPWINADMGNVDNPSYIPISFLGFTSPMDFFHRMANALLQSFSKVIYDCWFRRKDQAIANEVFGSHLPNLKEIAKQSRAMLVNTHGSLHGNRPHLPNVVEVGGLHIPPRTKRLPRDLAEFLDNASEGLLYFNFGPVIKMSTMPRKKLDAILDVLGSLPRKVLWKWEDDVLPRKMDNVMTRKWFPQFDVLSKPKSESLFFSSNRLRLDQDIFRIMLGGISEVLRKTLKVSEKLKHFF